MKREVCGFSWNPGVWPYGVNCCEPPNHDGEHRSASGHTVSSDIVQLRNGVQVRPVPNMPGWRFVFHGEISVLLDDQQQVRVNNMSVPLEDIFHLRNVLAEARKLGSNTRMNQRRANAP